ncbi:MAG: carboxypeptidase regulatory-like domain-containing protein [Planctomycetota bacterium]
MLIALAVWFVLRQGGAGPPAAGAGTAGAATGATAAADAGGEMATEPGARSAADAADGLRGVIVDRDGAPVPDALVAAVALAEARAVEARTDAAGAFALPALPPVPLQLVVQHDDFLPWNRTLGPADRAPQRVQLARLPRVSGRVVDAVTAAPVEQFAVALVPREAGAAQPMATPPPGAETIRSADGVFALRSGAVGPHAVHVFAAHGIAAPVPVELAGDGEVECTVRLQPAARMRGQVRDSFGQPVADARVELTPAGDPSRPGASATTDDAGAFELPPLAGGDYRLLVQPMALPVLQMKLHLDDGASVGSFDLQLPRGAALDGVVVPWQAGSRAEVVLVHEHGAVRRAAVDPGTGEFALRGVTPGPSVAFVERLEPTWRNRVARMLRADDDATPVALDPDRPAQIEVVDPTASMARVRGRVTGIDDPTRVVVRAFCESRVLADRVIGMFRAVPGADGAFELDGFVPGTWRLQVMVGADVLVWETVELAAGADVLRNLRVD